MINNLPGKKLSIAFILPDTKIPAWINKSIAEIAKIERIRIVLLVIMPENNKARRARVFSKDTFGKISVGLHRFVDRIYNRIPDYALSLTRIPYELDAVPVIFHQAAGTGADNGGLINLNIQQSQADLVISFSSHFDPVFFKPENIHYGIWHFKHGKYEVGDSYEIGLHELVNEDGELYSELNIYMHNRVIRAASTCSMMHLFSQRISLDNHFWKCSYLLPRMLSKENLMAGIPVADSGSSAQKMPVSDLTARLKEQNGYSGIIGLMLKNRFRRFLFTDQWILLFGSGNWTETIQSPEKIKTIVPPNDRFWADPFLVTRDGKNYVFFEEYENKLKRGYISVLQIDKDGHWMDKTKVLDRPYHLSYPFIFEYRGNYYMIPETASNKTIELYQCTKFPYQWEFVKNIMENITAHDTSILFFEGKIWMFTCIKQKGIRWNYDDLNIFHNTDLFDDHWISHPQNPVISDVKRARPAGKFFMHENKLYRPSQNSSGRYGRALNINCVDVLNETSYKESLVYELDSSFNKELTAVHTLNSENGITLLDGILQRKHSLFGRFFMGSLLMAIDMNLIVNYICLS
jgi:hypothetical protein